MFRYAALFSLLVILLVPGLVHSLECPPAPRQITREEFPKYAAWARALIRTLGTKDFKAEQTRVGKEVSKNRSVTDNLIERLTFIHLVCRDLADDATIPEHEKREKIIEFEQRFDYRRTTSAAAPNPVDRDDAITEVVLAIRTAQHGRAATSDVRVELLVDGSPTGTVRKEQAGTDNGDLETLTVVLTPPIPILHCRNLSMDVVLDGVGDSWTFNLTSVAVKTQKGRTFFNLFAPLGPVKLHNNHRAQNFNIHVNGCRQQLL